MSALKKLSDRFAHFDEAHHVNKFSLIVIIVIFAAIPLTVFTAITIRQINPQAATGQPTLLTPANNSTTTKRPSFSWSCICYTTKYRVYLKEGDQNFYTGWYKDVSGTSADYGGWKSTTNSTAVFPGFKTATYYWTVGCTPGYGSCTRSAIFSFKVDATAPTIPTGLRAINQSFGNVALAWNASTDNSGAVGYRVYRSQRVTLEQGFGSNIYVCQVAYSTNLTCTDTNFEGGQFTNYYVLAYDGYGNQSIFSQPLVMYTPDNDLDKDGFFDTKERYIGTNVRSKCGSNAWPPDFNSDGKVDVTDQQILGANYLTGARRYDLDANGSVNSIDLAIEARYVGQQC